jgi:hypothetical protein
MDCDNKKITKKKVNKMEYNIEIRIYVVEEVEADGAILDNDGRKYGYFGSFDFECDSMEIAQEEADRVIDEVIRENNLLEDDKVETVEARIKENN